jgi:hypothetical protein
MEWELIAISETLDQLNNGFDFSLTSSNDDGALFMATVFFDSRMAEADRLLREKPVPPMSILDLSE